MAQHYKTVVWSMLITQNFKQNILEFYTEMKPFSDGKIRKHKQLQILYLLVIM